MASLSSSYPANTSHEWETVCYGYKINWSVIEKLAKFAKKNYGISGAAVAKLVGSPDPGFVSRLYQKTGTGHQYIPRAQDAIRVYKELLEKEDFDILEFLSSICEKSSDFNVNPRVAKDTRTIGTAIFSHGNDKLKIPIKPGTEMRFNLNGVTVELVVSPITRRVGNSGSRP